MIRYSLLVGALLAVSDQLTCCLRRVGEVMLTLEVLDFIECGYKLWLDGWKSYLFQKSKKQQILFENVFNQSNILKIFIIPNLPIKFFIRLNK